jgi:hypothetical protein
MEGENKESPESNIPLSAPSDQPTVMSQFSLGGAVKSKEASKALQ